MAHKAFQDNLLKALQIQEASETEKEKFLNLFAELANQITLDCILHQLRDPDAKTFLNLLDTDESGDKALTFAKEKIPTLDDIVTKRLTEEIDVLNASNT